MKAFKRGVGVCLPMKMLVYLFPYFSGTRVTLRPARAFEGSEGGACVLTLSCSHTREKKRKSVRKSNKFSPPPNNSKNFMNVKLKRGSQASKMQKCAAMH